MLVVTLACALTPRCLTGVAREQGAFVLYLACFLVGQTFLSFQWDILLLEAGFLTILYAPLVPKSREPAPAPATWLLRVLLFKCVSHHRRYSLVHVPVVLAYFGAWCGFCE